MAFFGALNNSENLGTWEFQHDTVSGSRWNPTITPYSPGGYDDIRVYVGDANLPHTNMIINSGFPVSASGDKTAKIWTTKLSDIESISIGNAYFNKYIINHVDFSEFTRCTSFNTGASVNNRIDQVTFPSHSLVTTLVSCFFNGRVTAMKPVDLSTLGNLGGNVKFEQCIKLSEVILPTTNPLAEINDFDFQVCTILSSSFDLSGLNFGDSRIYLQSCNIPSFIPPTGSNISTELDYINLSGNDISGTLDLSPLGNKFEGSFYTYTNSNLNQITNPTSPGAFTFYHAYSCDLTGNLDVSGLTGLGGDFRAYLNSNLTSITNPTSSQVFTKYYVRDCDLGYVDFKNITGSSIDIQIEDNNMTATEVNHILVDLDNLTWTSGSITIDGTNATPDATSGGYNGNAATASLVGKSWTVTTS